MLGGSNYLTWIKKMQINNNFYLTLYRTKNRRKHNWLKKMASTSLRLPKWIQTKELEWYSSTEYTRIRLFNKRYFVTQTQALGPHNSQPTHLNRLNNYMLGQEERLSFLAFHLSFIHQLPSHQPIRQIYDKFILTHRTVFPSVRSISSTPVSERTVKELQLVKCS